MTTQSRSPSTRNHRNPALVECLFMVLLGGWAPSAVQAATVVVLGDSLSAAYGIALDSGWVALLARRLGPEHRVVNASISGDTTAGGRARLPSVLAASEPAVVIVELGGNDGLRGLSLSEMRANLSAILDRVAARGAKALLVGMRIPPNLGPRYAAAFEQSYPDLADRHQVPLIGFLLAGVATDPALMRGDGIHPNADAQPKILANVWPALQRLLAGE